MAEKVNMPSQKKEKKKKRKKNFLRIFMIITCWPALFCLVSFGLIMLYSASAYEAASTFKGNDMYYFTHQAGAFCYCSGGDCDIVEVCRLS